MEILHLKKLNAITSETRDNQLVDTRQAFNSIQKTFRTVRDQLQTELKLDERRLVFMTNSSNKALEHLRTVLRKGRQILALVEICGKFETEEEKVMKWRILRGEEIDDYDEKESETNVPTPEPEKAVALLRPKTTKARPTCSLTKKTGLTIDDVIEPIDKIVFTSKRYSPSAIQLQAARIASQKKTDFLEETFKPLFDLERLWAIHSRVEVNLLELKREKRDLLRENEQLKRLLRNVLEATVLKSSPPCSRISSGVVSRKMRGRSAPPKCFS